MKTLEFFMWLICALLLSGFVYTVAKRPFFNDYKRSLLNAANGLCILALGVLSFFYFQGKDTSQIWYLLIVALTVVMGVITTNLINAKFHETMYEKTHLFRLTAKTANNMIYGKLAITGTKETVEARLVCPLYAEYHYGDIIPVRVLVCRPNEIIVEPTEN